MKARETYLAHGTTMIAVPACRDERCQRLDLHAVHGDALLASPRARQRRKRLLGWADDPFEPGGGEPRIQVVLDEVILRAVGTSPKNFSTLYNDVVNDFGSVHVRRLHRRLALLTQLRKVVCVDLGSSLRGYVRPDSRLLRDAEGLRERLEDLVYSRAHACAGS